VDSEQPKPWYIRAMAAVNRRFPNPVILILIWTAISLVVVSIPIWAVEQLGGRAGAWIAITALGVITTAWFYVNPGANPAQHQRRRNSVWVCAAFTLLAIANLLLGQK
jgi:hypothetical protein